jgi:hypothetical protein
MIKVRFSIDDNDNIATMSSDVVDDWVETRKESGTKKGDNKTWSITGVKEDKVYGYLDLQLK